jgi:dUTP pyrophosphatase
MYILYISPSDSSKDVYAAAAAAYMSKPYHERDAGFDLFSESIHVEPIGRETATCAMVDQQVMAACYDTERKLFRAFWMLPRSSLSKTPLRLANSVGLIDAGYRGSIKAAVTNFGSSVFDSPVNNRYFQLATPDLLPWNTIEIGPIPGSPTLRGAGGFGSTGLDTTGMTYFA